MRQVCYCPRKGDNDSLPLAKGESRRRRQGVGPTLHLTSLRCIRTGMKTRLCFFFLLAAITALQLPRLHSQERKFIASPQQLIAIRAGRLFDARSGSLLTNQVILIRGDRIADIGGSV